jgi:colicin import membrane protein
MAVKGAKNKRVVEQQEQVVLKKVENLTFDSVTKELAGVQVELQRSLAELAGTLAEQFQLLEDVQKSIKLKEQELLELKQIDAAATTIDELKADIEEMHQQQKEQEEEFKRRFAEQKSEQQKQWAREEADYLYATDQKKRKMEDTLTYELEQKKKANREQQERLEKDWAERDAELKKREQELAELRKFKDDYPALVQKEVNQAVAVANNSLKKEYEHKMVLTQKDAEMEKKLAENQLTNATQTIAKLQAQVDDLKQQMAEAHHRVTEISTKALDSASGRATTEALQRMMETEKMSGKSTK